MLPVIPLLLVLLLLFLLPLLMSFSLSLSFPPFLDHCFPLPPLPLRPRYVNALLCKLHHHDSPLRFPLH